METRRIERATIIAVAAAAAIPNLLWLLAWELPASPRPGPEPGGLWSMFFLYDGTPSAILRKISDEDLRHLFTVILNGMAVNGLLALGLAVALAWRGYGNATGRLLCLALLLGTVSTTYDVFVREFTALRAAPRALLHAADLMMVAGDAVLFVLLYRFLRAFPAPVRVEELEGGRRFGMSSVNASIIRRLDNPRILFSLIAFACIVDLLAWLHGQATGNPVPLESLLQVVGTVIVLEGVHVMIRNGRRVVAADRRFEWIYLGLWYGLVTMFIVVLSIGFVARAFHVAPATFLLMLARMANVFGALYIGLLALTVFYQGALDARLVIRRTAVVAFLGMAAGILFIAAERLLALFVVRSLALPEEWAWTLAAIVAAVAVLPVRKFADRAFTALTERLSAPSELADGERTHAVMVFSDLSGFTALSARDERSAIIAASLLHKTARDAARACGGRLVKTIGDAVVMEFSDPAAAVAATMDVHSKYGQGSAALGLPALEVHSGIHAGDVIRARDGDIYGSTVNLTARLQDAAKAGEIVVSDAVSACVASRAFSWQSLGEKTFKNIPSPVACSRLVPI